MKKVVLTIVIALVTLVSNAQLREVKEPQKLGEVKTAGYFISSITYFDKGNFTLTYWDASYKTIDVYNTIQFTATDAELILIKDMFVKQLSAEKNSEKTFGLGNNVIMIKTIKAFGMVTLTLYITNPTGKTGYFHLTDKNVDTLFGELK